ncbi:MAG: NADH:flavin oxidoreductase [Pirellulales bacterium]
MSHYPKVAQFRSAAAFQARLAELQLELPVDVQPVYGSASPLAAPFLISGFTVGNRWCIHPMEGWDGQADGNPSPLTVRRWGRFGQSGAKLIWGGEAAAVRHDGRANPRQILATPAHQRGLSELLETLQRAHQAAMGRTDDLLVGLQLTHSGRFCRPNSQRLEPRIAYHHPLLDAKFGIAADDSSMVWTDDQLERLIDDYLLAARTAQQAGFQFVDIKACHGYLLHEFLSARSRPGRFGGDLDGRTRLLRTIVARIRSELPGLVIGVRLSVFDAPPFQQGPVHGEPMDYGGLLPYRWAFGANPDDPLQMDLAEPIQLLKILADEGVSLVNLSCASPYYNPHLMRPAIFPPSDGYLPPEDPLVGVVRQIQAVRTCKAAVPELPLVGTGYTYLQEFLPHVAQGVVRSGWVDFVGLGRMVLSYPTLPADLLLDRRWQRKLVCRTFSDCTTAPRRGLISGCYPLDEFYKDRPEARELKHQAKQQSDGGGDSKTKATR